MPRWLRSWGQCSDLAVLPSEAGGLRRGSRQAVVFPLLAYRRLISPLLPPGCRFYPSCSAYAIQAVARHGVVRGAVYTARRLLRCHPLHPGGYDPVPPAVLPTMSQWTLKGNRD
jgi:putative membrane protein insertion efficiency factor